MQWMSVANYCPVIICNQIVLAAIDVLILWITGLATIFKFRNSWFQFISLLPVFINSDIEIFLFICSVIYETIHFTCRFAYTTDIGYLVPEFLVPADVTCHLFLPVV